MEKKKFTINRCRDSDAEKQRQAQSFTRVYRCACEEVRNRKEREGPGSMLLSRNIWERVSATWKR